jgi:hypothetical protein
VGDRRKKNDPEQSKRFLEAAKEIDADGEKAFELALESLKPSGRRFHPSDQPPSDKET